MSSPPRSLRRHQAQVAAIVNAIAGGDAHEVGDILAAVTPGGGKSLLPVIAAVRLIAAGVIDRVCWVVPRDSLRLQAEEAFADPGWRAALGHGLTVRAAENSGDLCRGLDGYVTTYQGIAAAPALHLAAFRAHRYLLVVDEIHHLPALSENTADPVVAPRDDEASGWSRAIMPLLETARLRLLLSGTLERADGRGILWLPYRKGPRASTREVDLAAPGWAVVGYSRAQALADRAVLPVMFGALDGEAKWLDEDGLACGPHRLFNHWPTETTRPALFTALRTGFADELLKQAFRATRALRAQRRRVRGLPADASARGLGKLLVVAPDQTVARQYLDRLRAWVPRCQTDTVRLATSSEADAHQVLAGFRLNAEPSVLVTVAMAYEGLDAPEVAVVAALTHIRSRPWLEQMVARATRIDPHAGDYASQRALVFHPDDPLFARFRLRLETEQGTLAKKPTPKKQRSLPLWLREQLADQDEPADHGITPLESNALALRYALLKPGPDLAMMRPEHEAAQAELIDPPSVIERRLRARVGEMVAMQAVEDEVAMQAPRGPGLYHGYNAVLKRIMGNRSRGEMTIAELEASLGWLERHRLSDHLDLLQGDPKYAWTVRKRNGWAPPVGRADGRPRGAPRVWPGQSVRSAGRDP
ncbi:MAG: restriction endonuclease subunit R [Rhodospirillales bacterium 20-64-7]|nr:MAG: restriction endonuclease subunit R [Rhodospirillales bacterium 20-64-7]HQT77585.1 DEAD/DEAH box helicase family protein [Rhodopila sp.]